MHGQQGLAFQVCANKLTSQETQESAYKNNKTKISTDTCIIYPLKKKTTTSALGQQNNWDIYKRIISCVHMINHTGSPCCMFTLLSSTV